MLRCQVSACCSSWATRSEWVWLVWINSVSISPFTTAHSPETISFTSSLVKVSSTNRLSIRFCHTQTKMSHISDPQKTNCHKYDVWIKTRLAVYQSPWQERTWNSTSTDLRHRPRLERAKWRKSKITPEWASLTPNGDSACRGTSGRLEEGVTLDCSQCWLQMFFSMLQCWTTTFARNIRIYRI